MYRTLKRIDLGVLVALLGVTSGATAYAAAVFTPIPHFPGGLQPQTTPFGVSADGKVVYGRGSSARGIEVFRWTHADGLVGLGDLPGGAFYSSPFASGFFADPASADGSVIVGLSESENGWEAFRWTATTGMVGLGDLPGGGFESVGERVSANGSVIVGSSFGATGGEAFRWTAAGGMVGLGGLPGGDFSIYTSIPNGISADGSVIVGQSIGANNNNEAFRWTEATGMVGLGLASGVSSEAMAVSADGSVVVGIRTSSDALRSEAFRWTEASGTVGLGILGNASLSWPLFASTNGSVVIGRNVPAAGPDSVWYWTESTGMTGLGLLPGGIRAYAEAASADGSVVVGTVEFPGSTRKAFYWTRDTGMLDLHSLLVNDGALIPAGWSLTEALGVSANGRTIVGLSSGEGPYGTPWVATLSATGLPGDFDGDGTLTARDIDLLSAAIRAGSQNLDFDVNQDARVDSNDHTTWVHDLRRTYFGDANLDSEFNSSDLVSVFQAGQYEDSIVGNSTWSHGDWNGDGEFDSSDMVTAFADGGYERGFRTTIAVVPEPSSIALLFLGAPLLSVRGTRRPSAARLKPH